VTARGSWIGANFWSRSGGPRMWARYNPDLVREELAVLTEHGCSVTRSFCYWPDFVPEPERLDETVIERFQDFLDAHVEVGLGTIPTFIVGHMSGDNWDPPWRGGRDLYRDVWLVSQQAWFAEQVARRFAGHEAVVGWLISNEMPLYGGEATAEDITSWARILVQAVRAGGGSQPVSLGDGGWGVEVSGNDNGYSLRALAPLVDFIGPHVYPMSDDMVRQSIAAAFACELSSSFGRPVILEEFGLSSDFVSDENGAHYYRQVLHTSLLAGATGWIAWNNCDYDGLRDQDPYRHHPFEMHFGLTDRSGKPKPQLAEVARFSRLVGELGQTGWQPVAGEVAIVVPEHFERTAPFSSPAARTDMRDNMLQSYIAAREADLPVALVRERDGVGDGAKLLLLPSTKLLTAPTADRLVELAERGATVYLSYFAGSTSVQRGSWIPSLGEIFGVQPQAWYGLVDPVQDNELTFTFTADLGDIAAGEQVSFSVAGNESARSFLPVEPAGATVLAIDGHGRPALLQRRIGSGWMVLCTYPVEHMAARTPRVNPESTWRLYAALAEVAGVQRLLTASDPRVMTGLLRTGDGEVAVLVNTSAQPVEVRLITTGTASYGRPHTAPGEALRQLTLPPFEVEILSRLT
jgi:endo-1,4-beta-mannosidase